MSTPFLLKPGDWTWWLWAVVAALLTAGIAWSPACFLAAGGVVVLQMALVLARSRRPAFAIQLRLAYLLLLALAWHPELRWLYWLPMLGTWALVLFGYCLLARMLALLPWNRDEPLGRDYLRRVFLTAPDPRRAAAEEADTGCAGGMCSIAAQVAPATARRERRVAAAAHQAS